MRPILFALLCMAAWPAHTEEPLPDPGHWIGRMLEAAHEVSYQGEVVHLHGRKVQSMEITYRSEGDHGIERLLMLDGPPREVIRDGKRVTCIVPDGRESLAGQRVPRNPFPGKHWRTDESIEAHYEFLDLGEDRVADRQCRVIGIKPRDAMRYGYRLWIDVETGLLLKSELVDEEGQVIEQVAFTRIELPDEIGPERVRPTLSGDTLHWDVSSQVPAVEKTSWTITEVPDGFTIKVPHERSRGVIQQVITDGLASISVFVAPQTPARESLRGLSRMGAVSAFGTVVDGWQVTVVGEVPPAAVRTIGESLAIDRDKR